jgi:hypothetical protein
MHEDNDIRNVVFACSINNGYSGLDRFREYSKKHGVEAFEIGWRKITEYPDEDDGALICEILRVLSEINTDMLRARLFEQWGEFDDEHRSAIISAAGRSDILPLNDWLRLFDDERSRVRDRHLLVASLASGAYSEAFRPHVERCVKQIGRYNEAWHNDILDDLIQGLRKFYGLDH